MTIKELGQVEVWVVDNATIDGVERPRAKKFVATRVSFDGVETYVYSFPYADNDGDRRVVAVEEIRPHFSTYLSHDEALAEAKRRADARNSRVVNGYRGEIARLTRELAEFEAKLAAVEARQ